jgi:hypothetical protein
MNVNVRVFKSNWPMAAGYYWSFEKQQLLRGPFTTWEEAEADLHQIGEGLWNIILDAQASDPPFGSA